MEDGAAVETATVGNEGMIGLPVFLGADTIPMKALSQIPGDAIRIEADVFKDLKFCNTAADRMKNLLLVSNGQFLRRPNWKLVNLLGSTKYVVITVII